MADKFGRLFSRQTTDFRWPILLANEIGQLYRSSDTPLQDCVKHKCRYRTEVNGTWRCLAVVEAHPAGAQSSLVGTSTVEHAVGVSAVISRSAAGLRRRDGTLDAVADAAQTTEVLGAEDARSDWRQRRRRTWTVVRSPSVRRPRGVAA